MLLGFQLVSCTCYLDVIDKSPHVRLWSSYEDSDRRLLILLCRNESNKKGFEREFYISINIHFNVTLFSLHSLVIS